jgi:hypothetical protein
LKETLTDGAESLGLSPIGLIKYPMNAEISAVNVKAKNKQVNNKFIY